MSLDYYQNVSVFISQICVLIAQCTIVPSSTLGWNMVNSILASMMCTGGAVVAVEMDVNIAAVFFFVLSNCI